MVYLSDDKTYNPYGDSRKNEEGGLYEEEMNPTKITSSLQSVKLFNTLKYLDKDYNEIDLKAEDEIKVSIANAMRFSTKDNGEIMAVKHKEYNVYGLQFHPESILTPDGGVIIKNFIDKVEKGIL